jgi:ubiquitin carboxyl-terminal hydrolase 8
VSGLRFFNGHSLHVAPILAGTNGAGRLYDDMSVADIKNKAKEAVQRETRGATPLSLIKAARYQYDNGRSYERSGDLPNGLGSFIKAASLAKIAIDSEHAQGGLLQKEINEFMTVRAYIC